MEEIWTLDDFGDNMCCTSIRMIIVAKDKLIIPNQSIYLYVYVYMYTKLTYTCSVIFLEVCIGILDTHPTKQPSAVMLRREICMNWSKLIGSSRIFLSFWENQTRNSWTTFYMNMFAACSLFASNVSLTSSYASQTFQNSRANKNLQPASRMCRLRRLMWEYVVGNGKGCGCDSDPLIGSQRFNCLLWGKKMEINSQVWKDRFLGCSSYLKTGISFTHLE